MKKLLLVFLVSVFAINIEAQLLPNNQIADDLNVSSEVLWQVFKGNHHSWNAEINNKNGSISLALGKGIKLSDGQSIEEKASNFISTELKKFIDVKQLDLVASNKLKKYFLTYKQSYNGLDVISSYVKLCVNENEELVLFKSNWYPNINLNTIPTLTLADAVIEAQKKFIGNVNSTDSSSELKIFPVYEEGKDYSYKLVYEIYVETNSDGLPGYYYTLVDAHTGKILARENQVKYQVDVNLKSTVYPYGPLEFSDTFALAHLKITSGIDYFTDSLGKASLTSANHLDTVTYFLEGPYIKVRDNLNGLLVPEYKTVLDTSLSRVSFDGQLDIGHMTAFWAGNKIHDYMKSKLPTFTGLDFSLKTNVNITTDACNAFYTTASGQSLNFFKSGGGCNDMEELTDVVYHEYGHAINRNFYASQGAITMFNGALGEAYADVWAMAITETPSIGKGITNDPLVFVRRYDDFPKVYPNDLIGEVHADGEIIAGAWWDLGQNLGDVQQMMDDFFIPAYYLTPDASSGNEGTLYRQILIDVLTIDDDNADLTDGTPNDSAIIFAFDRHGINLLSNVDIVHTELSALSADIPTNVFADITVDYPFYVGDYILRYKTNYDPVWKELIMTETLNPNEFEVTLPAQPKGALMDYYIKVTTLNGNTGKTLPNNMELGIPNIAYKAFFGFTVIQNEDFDNSTNPWFPGDPFDNATSGMFEVGAPVASYLNPGMPTPEETVQPEFDHTTGGFDFNQCAFTGNASSNTLNALVADVDGGKTTIFSPVFSIQNFSNPMFSYFRWFSNNLGTNPNQDKFEAYITSDGIVWINVESTPTSDNSWRQNLVDVKQYIPIGGVAQMKFVVSDLGLPSLVEGAVDDLVLYNFEYGVGIDEKISKDNQLSLYPNPASDNVNLFIDNYQGAISIKMYNQIGQLVYNEMGTNSTNLSLNLQFFNAGIYFLEVELSDKNLLRKKLTITH